MNQGDEDILEAKKKKENTKENIKIQTKCMETKEMVRCHGIVLKDLYEKGFLSDFGIQDENNGAKINVHKNVLGVCSEFFRMKFENELKHPDVFTATHGDDVFVWSKCGWPENESIVSEAALFPEVIRSFYYGELCVSAENWATLYSIANKLICQSLLNVLKEWFLKNLNKDTLERLFKGCFEHDDTGDKLERINGEFSPVESCFGCIVENIEVFERNPSIMECLDRVQVETVVNYAKTMRNSSSLKIKSSWS